MPQPTKYSRQYNFQGYQSSNPTTPLPANKVEAELNAVKATLDETLENLKQIQRDDGAIANEAIGDDQLAPELAKRIAAIDASKLDEFSANIETFSGTIDQINDSLAGKATQADVSSLQSSITAVDARVTAQADSLDAAIAERASAAAVEAVDTQITALKTAGGQWERPTGTKQRFAFDTATVTLAQLAQVVAAIVSDNIDKGLYQALVSSGGGGTPTDPTVGRSTAYPNVGWRVPYKDFDVGRTNTAALKVPGTDALPAGCTITSGASAYGGTWKLITVTQNSTVLTDWDFSGYCLDVQSDFNTISQNVFDDGGPARSGTREVRDFPPVILLSGTAANNTIEWNTFVGTKTVDRASTVIAAIDNPKPQFIRFNDISAAPSDGYDIKAGEVKWNAFHDSIYNLGGHADGINVTNSLEGELEVSRNFIDMTVAADSLFQPNYANSAIKLYHDFAGERYDYKVTIKENVLLGGAHQIMTLVVTSIDGATATAMAGSSYIDITGNYFADDSPYGAGGYISHTGFNPDGWSDTPANVYFHGNFYLSSGGAIPDIHGSPPVSGGSTGGGSTGGGTTPPVETPGVSFNDYVASAWAASKGFSVPFQIPGKDYATGRISTAPLKTPTTSAAMTVAATSVKIEQPGIYQDYDFRGKTVWVNFNNTDPTAVIFLNCVFNNAVVTQSAYFGSEHALGDPRRDCSFEYCTFDGVTTPNNGGYGEYISNPNGIVHVYRCKFQYGAADSLNVGGGSLEECSFELWGNADEVHWDVVNWATTSYGPLHFKRCFIDGSLVKWPNNLGGFNSLVKWLPLNTGGPSHNLLLEEVVAYFSQLAPGDVSRTSNSSWYWFQQMGGTGEMRIKDCYLGNLKEGFVTLCAAAPPSNFALQNNVKLQQANARWDGPQSNNDQGVTLPGVPTVTLTQTNSTTVTPTFTLGANTTRLEYQYRKIGTARCYPIGYPPTAVSGSAITGIGTDYEFRYRGVRVVNGRAYTGAWTSWLNTGGVTVPNSDTPVSNSVLPSLSASAWQAGQTATINPGTWSGSPPPTFTFGVESSTDGGSTWSNEGISTTTFTLAEGKSYRANVTGTNGVGSPLTKTSAASPTVTAAPVGITLSAVGTPGLSNVGSGDSGTLTASAGAPAGTGGLLLLGVRYAAVDTGTIATPSGWTRVAGFDFFGTGGVAVFSKAGGSSDAAVVVSTSDARLGDRLMAQQVRFNGGSGTVVTSKTGEADAIASGGSISSTAANQLSVIWWDYQNDVLTSTPVSGTPPTGYTEQAETTTATADSYAPVLALDVKSALTTASGQSIAPAARTWTVSGKHGGYVHLLLQ